MTTAIKLAICALVGVFTAAAAQAFEPFGGTPADYAEIQAFHDRSIAKFNAGDLEGSIDDYLPQLRILHTQSMNIRDRDSMRESWSKAFANGKPRLISEIVDMGMNGDQVGAWAYIVCNYAAVTLDQESNKPKGDFSNGRYIALLSKTDAGWKVLLDIDNGAAGAAPELEAKLKTELGL